MTELDTDGNGTEIMILEIIILTSTLLTLHGKFSLLGRFDVFAFFHLSYYVGNKGLLLNAQ